RQVLYLADPWYANAGAGVLFLFRHTAADSCYHGLSVPYYGIYRQSGDPDAQCRRIHFRDFPWFHRVRQQGTDGGGKKPWFKLRQVHAEDHSSAGSTDLSSFSGEPVHYHPEGFHDPLR